jgi:hypothetical protein
MAKRLANRIQRWSIHCVREIKVIGAAAIMEILRRLRTGGRVTVVGPVTIQAEEHDQTIETT